MNNLARSLALVPCLLLAACDRTREVEVARTTRQDARNRILRCLVDCRARVLPAKSGVEVAFAVVVPEEQVALAVERLRIYGFDRDPVADEPAALGGLHTSEAQRQDLEVRRRIAAIERAISEHPLVLSVAVVLGPGKHRSGSPLGASPDADASTPVTSGVVLRAAVEPERRTEIVAELEELARNVIRGAGVEPTTVEVVALPPLPLAEPPRSSPAAQAAGAPGPSVAGIAGMPSRESGRRMLAFSLAANALFGIYVLVRLLRGMKRNVLQSQQALSLDRSLAGRPARATT